MRHMVNYFKNKKKKQICLVVAIFIFAAAIPMRSTLAAIGDKILEGFENTGILSILEFESTKNDDLIVIDPGHGGMDGGAVSADGTPEKNINLGISKYICELAEADGWRVVLTRDDDHGLYSETDNIRRMKTQDLVARREIIDEANPVLAVSIHLNSYKQDRTVRGAQVFFPAEQPGFEDATEKSQRLAEAIQARLIEGINDGTNRTIMPKKDVLILKNPLVPTVIVECGFLSNSSETNLLKNEQYQRKLAECVYLGILDYLGKKPKSGIEIIENSEK